ncbi:Ig-like domain repeat protein [Solirubrobacter phytolaccae]|uniref:Ig-like domain repeat protein n=1 Tax=Solirubrobacter phytolaccae TaxID=1404360 RepID=A0A9X3N4C4_9ACTN|nr:Ig-like domain repeat protein [Solirubrobacter phytolaccae]MDA0179473.1 Ig-like domain repeat protein [Solirubrobacter phytolaccae]
MTTFRPHIAVLAFAACLAAALFGPLQSANAAISSTYPTATDSRDFRSSNGSWSATASTGGLLCIPPLTCPAAAGEFVANGGTGGSSDGYIRATFVTAIGVASASEVTFRSPTFVAANANNSGTLSFNVRNGLGSLLTVLGGTATVNAAIVDVNDPTRSVRLADTNIDGTAAFTPKQVSVPAGAVAAGRTYRLDLQVYFSAGVAALLQSGNVALDDVNLTTVKLQNPTSLSAVASTSGQVAINGSVNPNGLSTSVRVEYGTTAAYGTSVGPVVVTGTGAQAFSIPVAGLTAGTTYHYRTVAQNSDGTQTTSDATFTVPFVPANSAPNVTGALNSRSRTVTYDQVAGTTGVTIEVLNGDGTVAGSTADNDLNGNATITLPNTDGTYGVRIKRDGAGGGQSTSTQVPALLDRSAPSTAGMNASVAPSLSSDRVRTVTFTMPVDAVSAEAQVIDSNGADVGSPVTATGGNASVTLGTPDGDYRVRVTVRDAAGNGADVVTNAVALDRTAPSVGGAPLVTGADSSRNRTVTFTRDSDTFNATVEVLDNNGAVVLTTNVANGGTAQITLPDADGAYSVRVRQTDAAGNASANSGLTGITLDRQPPAAGAAPTVTGALANPVRNVSFTRPVDASTAIIEAVRPDGTVAATSPVANGGAGTVTLPSDGAYDIRVRFADTAGNESLTPNTRVTLDTTTPGGITAMPVVSGATNDPNRTVVFTRDPGTTSAEIIVTYGSNPTPVITQSVAADTDTITLPGPDGTYHVIVKQISGGTTYTSDPRDVTLDTAAPSAGAAPAVNGPRNDPQRTVIFTRANDAAQVSVEVVANGNVISTVNVPSGNSTPITLGSWDGEYFVRVRQSDAAGNSAVTPDTRAVLDRTAPVAGPAPTVTGADNDATRHVAFTRAPDATTATVEIVQGGVVVDSVVLTSGDETDVTLPADGNYTIRVRQTDAAGNDATTPATPVGLDRGAPAASGAPNVTGAVTTRTRTVAFTRAGDAVTVKVEATRNGVTTAYDVPSGATTDITLPDTDGDYAIRVRQLDAAGNDSVSPATDITLDRTGPAAGPAPTVSGSVNAPARHVTFTRATDTDHARVEVVDGNGTVVATANVPTGNEADVTLPADGTYTVRVRQYDANGNDSVTPTTTAKLDRNGPVAGPAPTVTGDGNSLNRHVKFTRAGDAVTATIVVVKAADGSETTFPVGAGDEADITLPTADGTYTVYVRQTNGNGNDSDTPVTTVSLDRAAPAAGGAPTVTGAVTVRQRAVTFTRAGDAATARVEILDANGTSVGTVDVPSGNTANVTLPDTDGAYRVRVRQWDGAGNDAVTPSADIALDRTGPAAGGAPTITGATSSRTRTVTFTRAGDAAAAAIEVLDANGNVISSTNVAGNSGDVTLPDVDGTYSIRVRQTDAAGNASVTPVAPATLTRGTTGTGGEDTGGTGNTGGGGTGIGGGGGTGGTETNPGSGQAVASDPGGFGSLLTDCYGASASKLVLSDVKLAGSTVTFAGLSVYAPGTRIAIVDSKKRTVTTASADATGRFTATATAPVKAERKTIRYTAVVGAVKTKALKLVRATTLTTVSVSGNTATLTGKIVGAKGSVKLAVRGGRGATACKGGGGKLKFVGKAKYSRKTGKFSVKVNLPKGTAGKTAVRVRVTGGINSASLYVIK